MGRARDEMSWDQARAEIDSGRTGDKVDHPDPATAPLGTDAEAGGAPTPGRDVRRSVERERQAARATRRGFRGVSVVAALVLALLAALVVVLLM